MAYIRDLTLPLYLRVTERVSKKKVTLQVIATEEPGSRRFTREVYKQLLDNYVSEGWSVTEGRKTSSVYILMLNEASSLESKMIAQNKDTNNIPVGYLYVGMTGLTVEDRVNNHIKGYKSCNLVKKHYLEIFGSINDLFHYEAEQLEKLIPFYLRSLGFWVYQA